MASIISAIISILAKVLPSVLDWITKEAAKPDKKIEDDTPAPDTTREWFADKVREHPGYQAHLEKTKK